VTSAASAVATTATFTHVGHPAGTTAGLVTLGVPTLARTYVWGSYVDELLMYVQGATKRFVLANHLYSVAAVTDASGVVQERYRYDAYGARTVLNAAGTTVLPATTVANQYSFTGRYIDSETGLLYVRARYYSAGLGRFTTRDPLGYIDGMSLYGNYFSPGMTDPSGLTSIFAFKKMHGQSDEKHGKKDHGSVIGRGGLIQDWKGFVKYSLPSVTQNYQNTVHIWTSSFSNYNHSSLFGLPFTYDHYYAKFDASLNLHCDKDTGKISQSGSKATGYKDMFVYATAKITLSEPKPIDKGEEITVTIEGSAGAAATITEKPLFGFDFGVINGSLGNEVSATGGPSVDVGKIEEKYTCLCQDKNFDDLPGTGLGGGARPNPPGFIPRGRRLSR
jgi:RHS repeat-associated protein